MAGWGSYHDFTNKSCVVCGVEFTPKSGVHKFCSPQCKGKWQYITGSGSTENQYKRISGNWKAYFDRLVQKERREQLTTEELLELFVEQDGKCALSGVEMTCNLEKGKIFKTNASIDRIVAGGPYTKDNVQLVCRALNSWRGDTDLVEFIDWCRKVAQFYEERSQSSWQGTINKEYDRYQGKPEQIKNRAKRNAARRELMAIGKVHKGDGKDVDHKKPLIKGGGSGRSNLRVQSKRANRSFRRTASARMK